MRSLLLLLSAGCASSLQPVRPAPQVNAIALGAKKAGLEQQAMLRAAMMKNGVAFVYKKGALKLAKPKALPDSAVTVSKREPSGFTATLPVTRTGDELDRLAKVQVAHVEGEGTSSDPGKAQLKAESQLLRAAIAKAAKAAGKQDQALKGRLKIVNYEVAEEGRLVTIAADIFVAFHEPPASLPVAASQPASAPIIAKVRPRDADEPEDGQAPPPDLDIEETDTAEAMVFE